MENMFYILLNLVVKKNYITTQLFLTLCNLFIQKQKFNIDYFLNP